MEPSVLSKCLCNFIIKVRKKNRMEFPTKILHHLISEILEIRSNEWKNIDDAEFSDMRGCLDSEMKRLGSNTRKAEPLNIEEEELLWS